MKSHLYSRSISRRQHGAVLVVSLLLLLVMTLLGLGAAQSTRLQERMAGNQRDQEIALQGAEASLRAAEELLAPTRSAPLISCVTKGSSCEVYEMRTLVDSDKVALDLSNQADAWWNDWGRDYADAAKLEDVSTKPEFVIERIAEVREGLGVGDPNLDTVRDFYQSTARSTGLTDTAQVVIQSSYARISFE